MQPESNHMDVSNLLSASNQKQQNLSFTMGERGEKSVLFF